MDETALSSCIAWIALGFEIVQSIYPGWKFSAADTVAANGVQGALLIGPRHPFAPHDRMAADAICVRDRSELRGPAY
jgi:2-oxo-3-hexenedioate decarboxylase